MSQIVLERTTNLSPKNILTKAKRIFKEEHGMDLEEESSCCLRFTGSAGFVFINIQEEQGKTQVEIKSREWAEVSKMFIKKL